MDWSKVNHGRMFLAAMQNIHDCKMCGKCCKGMKGIALSRIDTIRMSKEIGIPEKEFIKTYTTKSNLKDSDRHYIPVGPEIACPFLTPQGCAHYEGRGQVCRHFPWCSAENTKNIEAGKPVMIYQQCVGMPLTYKGVVLAAMFISEQEAKDILNSNIGRILFVSIADMEGRGEAYTKKLLWEIGVDKMPTQGELHEMGFKYAVAYTKTYFSPAALKYTMENLDALISRLGY